MRWFDPRGSATIELAVVAPALLSLLGLVIVAGRVTAAGSAVEQAAAAGARAASLARDARAAEASADQLVAAALRAQGLRCQEITTSVDTSGFARRIGSPAAIALEVRCTVPLRDVAVPGMPGQRTLVARATSPLDTYRGRG